MEGVIVEKYNNVTEGGDQDWEQSIKNEEYQARERMKLEANKSMVNWSMNEEFKVLYVFLVSFEFLNGLERNIDKEKGPEEAGIIDCFISRGITGCIVQV